MSNFNNLLVAVFQVTEHIVTVLWTVWKFSHFEQGTSNVKL